MGWWSWAQSDTKLPGTGNQKWPRLKTAINVKTAEPCWVNGPVSAPNAGSGTASSKPGRNPVPVGDSALIPASWSTTSKTLLL